MSSLKVKIQALGGLLPLLLLLAAAALVQAGAPEHRRGFHDSQEGDEQEEGYSSQLAESLAISATAAAMNANGQGVNLQCERIMFAFCSSMPYNYTRMPNYFADPNQVTANEHAIKYAALVGSRCSAHLLTYLCELLAPMCLEGEANKKFEIFPCRSFCRHVLGDCYESIRALGLLRDRAFACDSLAFESNGGDGSAERGPCHEAPTAPARHELAYKPPGLEVYRPYDHELEAKEPPFIDRSPIDPTRVVRPSTGPHLHPHQNPNHLEGANNGTQAPTGGPLSAQVQLWGQQLALALVRYSNVLSVLTLICLLLVVNAKRLKRLRAHLAAGRRKGSSSSSSSSSSGSQRRLAKGSPSLGQQALHHKHSMSPSSSSRSLMLIAADGKRPSHKLVSEQLMASLEPSQKLVQAGLDRRTLINVNGTLERQQQQQQLSQSGNNNNARYHLMQAAGLANQHHAQQHQYDYIQTTDANEGAHLGQHPAFRSASQRHQHAHQQRAPEQEPAQEFSNILLSSPSHQVFLFSDQQAAGAEEGPRLPWAAPPSGRSHFITAASLSSPYAAPEIVPGAGGSMNRRLLLQHQQQQREQAKQRLREHQHHSVQRQLNASNSSRHWRPGSSTTAGAKGGSGGAYVSCSGASSSSSSSGSSSLGFSGPGEPMAASGHRAPSLGGLGSPQSVARPAEQR